MKRVIDYHGVSFEIPDALAEHAEILRMQEEDEIFPLVFEHTPGIVELFVEFLALRAEHGPVEYSCPVPFDSRMDEILALVYCDFLIRVGNGSTVHELRKIAQLFACEDLNRLMTVHISRLCGIYTKDYLEATFPPLKILSDVSTQAAMEPRWFERTPFEHEAKLRQQALYNGVTTIDAQNDYILAHK
jgi:hypothetical protein